MKISSSHTKIKDRVLNRVFGIWFLRSAAPLLILELVVIIIALGFFAQYVFVDKVISNALLFSFENPFKLIRYFTSAFMATALIKKVIIIGMFTGLIFLLKDMNRSILSYIAMKRSQIITRRIEK